MIAHARSGRRHMVRCITAKRSWQPQWIQICEVDQPSISARGESDGQSEWKQVVREVMCSPWSNMHMVMPRTTRGALNPIRPQSDVPSYRVRVKSLLVLSHRLGHPGGCCIPCNPDTFTSVDSLRLGPCIS